MFIRLRFPRAAWLLFGLATVAVAGIVHIASVLALPFRAPDDAFMRVAAITAPNAVTALNGPEPGLPTIPFRDPAMAAAICRYNLGMAPFRVSLAPFEGDFLSIGLHSRHGVTFYGLTVRSNDETGFDLVLVTPSQRQAIASKGDDDAPSHDIVVDAPESEGFVLIQTPITGGRTVAETRETLHKISCRSQSAGAP